MIRVAYIHLNLKAFESEFGPTFYSDDWAGFPHVSSLCSELKQTGCWWLLYMLCQFSSISCVCKPQKQSDYNAADPLKHKIKCLHNFFLYLKLR